MQVGSKLKSQTSKMFLDRDNLNNNYNTVERLRKISGDERFIDISNTQTGVYIRPVRVRNEDHRFTFDFEPGVGLGVLTVYGGTVRLAGIANIAVADTDITLATPTEYIYIMVDRLTNVGTIEQMATEPVSSLTQISIPICLWTETAANYEYALTKVFHHGDIFLDSPIA